MEVNQAAPGQRIPWNKGKLVGQKAPFKPKDVWAIRARMERERRSRELALFNLGIDSKLRGCDLVALKVRDIQARTRRDGPRRRRSTRGRRICALFSCCSATANLLSPAPAYVPLMRCSPIGRRSALG
jgi:hypothetical protein